MRSTLEWYTTCLGMVLQGILSTVVTGSIARMYDGTETRSRETRIGLAVEMRPFSPTLYPFDWLLLSSRQAPPLSTCHRTFSFHPSPAAYDFARIIVSFPFFFPSIDAPVLHPFFRAHELNRRHSNTYIRCSCMPLPFITLPRSFARASDRCSADIASAESPPEAQLRRHLCLIVHPFVP